ncbi:MAG: type II toxin-antitoxin system PemK/MazF family toxin [Acidobacteriota bacterium]
MKPAGPLCGEVWLVDLNPVRGHEQAGKRPALVVSVDLFNRGPGGLVVVLPISSKPKGVPFHVAVPASEGGLRQPSFIKCEDIRSVAKERLAQRLGAVSGATMDEVQDRLRILLDL